MNERQLTQFEKAGLMPESKKPFNEKEALKLAFEELGLVVQSLGKSIEKAEKDIHYPPLRQKNAKEKVDQQYIPIFSIAQQIDKAEDLLEKVSSKYPWDKNHEYFYQPVMEQLKILHETLKGYGYIKEDFNNYGKVNQNLIKDYFNAFRQVVSAHEQMIRMKAIDNFKIGKLKLAKQIAILKRKQVKEYLSPEEILASKAGSSAEEPFEFTDLSHES